MKARSPIKIVLSIIFTFVLTLVMVAFPAGIASADQNQISQVAPNSLENECNAETINAREKFVEDMGPTADAFATMGSKYLNCGKYSLAEKRYNKAIKLAEPCSTTALVAKYGLVEIKFFSGKIDEQKRYTLTKEISQKIDKNERGSLTRTILRMLRRPCPSKCDGGIPGRERNALCIRCS